MQVATLAHIFLFQHITYGSMRIQMALRLIASRIFCIHADEAVVRG